MKDVTVLSGRVLIRRVEAETTSPGGIVLPDAAKKKPQKGKIVSVGVGKMLDDGTRQYPQVKRGQIVLFTDYTGIEIEIQGIEFLVMDESDLIAIIHEE